MPNDQQSDQPHHEKIVRPIILEDGTIIYESESYYEDLAQVVRSRRKTVKTTQNDYANDVLKALSHIHADKTPVLQLTIRQSPSRGVFEIVKQWVETKQKLQ